MNVEVSEGKINIIDYINKFSCAWEGSFARLNYMCIADIYFQMKNGEDILQSLTSEDNFVVWPYL